MARAKGGNMTSMRRPSWWLIAVLCFWACGGDGFGPEELVADPAVDTGCAPAAVAAGLVRAKPVACADELVITEAGEDGPAEIVVRGPVEAIPLLQAAIATEAVDAVVEQHYVLEPD